MVYRVAARCGFNARPRPNVDAIDTSRERVEKTVIRMHMAGDVDSLRHKMCGSFVSQIPWISTALKALLQINHTAPGPPIRWPVEPIAARDQRIDRGRVPVGNVGHKIR